MHLEMKIRTNKKLTRTYQGLMYKLENQGFKPVSWKYSYDEEYSKEFNKEKMFKYSLLLALLPRNILDLASIACIVIIHSFESLS